MKRIPRFGAQLAAISLADRRTGRHDLRAIFRYILCVAKPPVAAMRRTVLELAGPPAEEVLLTTAQLLMDQGRVEGEAALLKRLLERRFGPLAEALRARIDGAGIDEIERWSVAIFDARTADEVVGDPLPLLR